MLTPIHTLALMFAYVQSNKVGGSYLIEKEGLQRV